MPFQFDQTVRVHRCDPAGGVFYPRYFEMLTICCEEWLLAVPGLRLSEMATRSGLLAPTLSISAEFQKPCRLGEELTWRVTPQHLGKSSCRLGYQLFAGTSFGQASCRPWC